MNKFTGVSLTLLMVASLASAVVIESPAAHIGLADQLARELPIWGFTSGAVVIVNGNSSKLRDKTANFEASADEIRAIAAILDGGSITDQQVVLGGVTYKDAQKDWPVISAENDDAGIVTAKIDIDWSSEEPSAEVYWVIGVYDSRLTREDTKRWIGYVASSLIEDLKRDIINELRREHKWVYRPYH